MLRRFPSLLLMLCVVAVLCSCRSVVRDTGTLDGGYSGFNAIEKPGRRLRMEQAALAVRPASVEEVGGLKADPLAPGRLVPALPDDMTTRGVIFIVAEPEWKSPKGFPEDPTAEDSIRFTIRERFYRYLLRAYTHPVRVRYNFRRDDQLIANSRVITIRTYVTDIKRGISVPRYLFGYGVGQTRIQIEGELWEGVKEPVKIGEFALRRAHGGYAQNGYNWRVLEDDYCLRYAAEAIIKQFTKELPPFIPGVEGAAADAGGDSAGAA